MVKGLKRFVLRWKWTLGAFAMIAAVTVFIAVFERQQLVKILLLDATILILAVATAAGSRRRR